MKIIGPKYITKHFYTKRYKIAFKLMQISKKTLQNVSFMEDLLLLNVQVYKPVWNGLTLATISWEARTGQGVCPQVTGERRTLQTSQRARGSAPLPAGEALTSASSW